MRRGTGVAGVALVALILAACGAESPADTSATSSPSRACPDAEPAQPTPQRVYGVGTTVITQDGTGKQVLVRTKTPVVETDELNHTRVAVVTVMVGTVEPGQVLVDDALFGLQADGGECLVDMDGQVVRDAAERQALLDGASTATLRIPFDVAEGTRPKDLTFLVYPGPRQFLDPNDAVGIRIGEDVPKDAVS